MKMNFSSPLEAQKALALATHLQTLFAKRLNRAADATENVEFERVDWLRDDGIHGGGWRLGKTLTPAFNRASINVSQVHYDNEPTKRLSSATAVSTIIHPAHPLAPSFHMHISWTQMRDGDGYWRMMADLNPAIPNGEHTRVFEEALKSAAKEHLAEGKADGDRYFFIPSLSRHRGVSHFYLEAFRRKGFSEDLEFASEFGTKMIDTYGQILESTLRIAGKPTQAERVQQRDYHSAYILQVLTLDRGTTSGLLVHDQNDVGILGSLPSFVNRELLESWVAQQPAPQDELLRNIVATLPATGVEIDATHRAALARVVREHYQKHPEALKLQASGSVVPPTVKNHG
jgi:coproporphyrinogen III oxidase